MGLGRPGPTRFLGVNVAKKVPSRLNMSQVKAKLKEAELPDLKAIAGAFSDLVGGPKAIAQMMKDEFDRSHPGSMIRARIIDTFLTTVKAASAKEAPRDSSLLTDEDVERELKNHILKMTEGKPEEILDHLSGTDTETKQPQSQQQQPQQPEAENGEAGQTAETKTAAAG